MAAATATRPSLHDPFSSAHVAALRHCSPAEASVFLSLLAVDNLVDSRSPPTAEAALLGDLLAVDAEFARAGTARGLKDGEDVLLDLLGTDAEVDSARGGRGPGGRRRAAGGALIDPYARKEPDAIERFAGMYAPADGRAGRLMDDAVMMHLLAVDEGFDHCRRYQKLIESDDCAIIGELHRVDKEVGGAKRRALLVEDLQEMLDVDRLVDGVKENVGGKRSIFSMKEKYSARLASSNSLKRNEE